MHRCRACVATAAWGMSSNPLLDKSSCMLPSAFRILSPTNFLRCSGVCSGSSSPQSIPSFCAGLGFSWSSGVTPKAPSTNWFPRFVRLENPPLEPIPLRPPDTISQLALIFSPLAGVFDWGGGGRGGATRALFSPKGSFCFWRLWLMNRSNRWRNSLPMCQDQYRGVWTYRIVAQKKCSDCRPTPERCYVAIEGHIPGSSLVYWTCRSGREHQATHSRSFAFLFFLTV